ncbi:MAG: CpsD/CapB family tyrosine-protein kinase [Candidatus Acidiferrales bacterium]
MSRTFDILHRNEHVAEELSAPAAQQEKANGTAQHRNRHGVAEDEVMKLVQRVFILPETAASPEAVAFCGVDEGAGCSWVCARAGEALAEESPGTVCIVDANLRTPSLGEYFGIQKCDGFAEAMTGTRPIREFARRLEKGNLWVVTAGAVGAEPNGALNPARLRARFSELRDEFDYVVMDTPAASSHPDAVLLAQLTDGVVLVVGSNTTRRETARIAKENFKASRVPILGAVLNRRTYPIPEALYTRL